MTQNMSEIAEKISRLEQSRTTVLGRELNFSFFEVIVSGERYYAVEVVGCGESSPAVIGKEYESAYELYESIVKLGVTPCTLQEIVSDNFVEMKY